MPDHVHFFARPEIGAQPMAVWVGMWKSVSSRRIAEALSIKPPIWQREYFDRYLRSGENYAEKWHYVEQNAIRAGLVEATESWPYRGTINNLMDCTCPDDGAGAPSRRKAGAERPDGRPAPHEPSPSASGLVRTLGPIDATMIVIGSMIGSGIFITSAESSRLSGAPGWLLLAWALAGLLTITGALCCSELATMMPRAGGVYIFLREAYGHSIGFLYGWTLFLVIQTGTIAAVAIAFAKFLGVFVTAVSPENYFVAPISFGNYAISLSTEQLVAIGLIMLLTWTNTRGLEVGKIIQNTFTFAKTAALVAVVIIGLSLGWNANSAALSSAWWNSWANGWSPQVAQPGFTLAGGLALALLFGKSMVGPLFAQTAWTNVTFIGSEIRNPGKNLVRALVIGCGSVVVLYVLANLAYVAVLPLSEIEHAPQNRVAVAMMNAIFGHPGALCMAAAIMISTFGCNNGLILSGARVYYAMARDRLFFKKVGTTNRLHVPAAALVAQGIWTVLLTLPRTVTRDVTTHQVAYGNVYNQLLEYIVSADLLFYMLMVVAVMILRRTKPDVDRPYRTWGYPVVPIISVLLAGMLIVNLGFLAPATSGIGILIVLTGVPAYFFWRKFGAIEMNLSRV